MRYFRLDLPESWGQNDPTFYREWDNGNVQVLNTSGFWQQSAMSSVEDVEDYYTSEVFDRLPEDRWTFREITKEELDSATKG